MSLIFGYHMPDFSFRGTPPEQRFDRIVESARAAEAAGFDLLTVMDHFYQIRGVGPETDPMLEAYTVLGGIAARTERIRLGTLVTGVTYRNPALLAKMATTLDVVSKGRAIFGLGGAWNEDEHMGYGFEFPPIGERLNRLDEALTIAKLMFTEERPSFEGRYYRIERALNEPRPIQTGGPPILVGGGGEKKTLRIAARHADLTHWFGGLEDLKRKLGILERYCEEIGRDFGSITKTIGAGMILVSDESEGKKWMERIPEERRASIQVATVDQAAERLRPFVDAGVGGFTFNNPTLPTEESIGLAGDLIRILRSPD